MLPKRVLPVSDSIGFEWGSQRFRLPLPGVCAWSRYRRRSPFDSLVAARPPITKIVGPTKTLCLKFLAGANALTIDEWQ